MWMSLNKEQGKEVDNSWQHPHFSIRVQQTPRSGWHLRPDPPEGRKKKRALAVICQPDLSHYSLQLIASLTSQPFRGSASAADCNTSVGPKAVIQISAWPLGRKGCFSPSLQEWSVACLCVRALLFLWGPIGMRIYWPSAIRTGAFTVTDTKVTQH